MYRGGVMTMNWAPAPSTRCFSRAMPFLKAWKAASEKGFIMPSFMP